MCMRREELLTDFLEQNKFDIDEVARILSLLKAPIPSAQQITQVSFDNNYNDDSGITSTTIAPTITNENKRVRTSENDTPTQTPTQTPIQIPMCSVTPTVSVRQSSPPASHPSSFSGKRKPYNIGHPYFLSTLSSSDNPLSVYPHPSGEKYMECHLYSYARTNLDVIPPTGAVAAKKIVGLLTDKTKYLMALEIFEGCELSGDISIILITGPPYYSPNSQTKIYSCVYTPPTQQPVQSSTQQPSLHLMGDTGITDTYTTVKENDFFEITPFQPMSRGEGHENCIDERYQTSSVFKALKIPIEISIDLKMSIPVRVIIQLGNQRWTGEFKMKYNSPNKSK